jgi:hypothetical protein
MVIRFFWKIHSYTKRKTFHGDFSIGCSAQLAYQAAPKIHGWKIVSLCHPNKSVVIHKPQIGIGGSKGLTNSTNKQEED